MLPSRNKAPATRVYLSAGQLCPEGASGWDVARQKGLSPVEQCAHWLQHNAPDMSKHRLHIELSGELTSLFCMPFSPIMDTPAAVLRMAGGYARHALGEAAPTHYAVIEPMHYGQPAIILGMDSSLASLVTNKPRQRVEPYAIAAWNRYSGSLAEHSWLAVIEPETITLLYKCGPHIHDAFVRPLIPSSANAGVVQALIRQQFHRLADAIYVVDEFGLIPADEPLGSLERISPALPVFSHIPGSSI